MFRVVEQLKDILPFSAREFCFDIFRNRKRLTPSGFGCGNGGEDGTLDRGTRGLKVASGLALSETICSELLIYGKVERFPLAMSPGMQKPPK